MPVSLKQRIQDLVGFDFTSNGINSEFEAIHQGFAEVIDEVDSSFLLKWCVAPIVLDTSPSPDGVFDAEGKKVLRVIRKDSNGGYRDCTETDINSFLEESDDLDSLYYPTKFNPIYTIDHTNGTNGYLKIRPNPTDTEPAKIFYIPYLAENDPGDASDWESVGIPNELEHAVALKASLYILLTMMSDKIQDDEDTEMLQMLQAQRQNLEQT